MGGNKNEMRKKFKGIVNIYIGTGYLDDSGVDRGNIYGHIFYDLVPKQHGIG